MIQKEAQGNLDSSDDLYFLTLLPFYHLSSFMSVSGDSSKPIIVAIVANFVIAIAKTVGFFFSGSSALLSESIHSFADVMNQALLYIGIRRGGKEETSVFHYGYSQERFFWNLVSAMGIFVLGCGVTVYHGFHDLFSDRQYKEEGNVQLIIEIILFISLLVESYSFSVAIKEIKSQAVERKKKFFAYLKESLDPSVSAVFWEDMAAITGIFLALIGIIMTSLTGDKTFDAVASIIIGLLMGLIAFHLAVENKKFLIDKAIPEYEMEKIYNILKEEKLIKSLKDVKTLVFGPDRLKFSAHLELNMEELSNRVREKCKNEKPELYHSLIEANTTELNEYNQLFNRVIQEEYKRIEDRLRSGFPSLKHIELNR